jgi:hypothetical protein
MHRRTLLRSALAAPLVIASPAALADSPFRIRDLYIGRDMSPFARQQDGNRLTLTGYMAPPLKAASGFFVLTNIPMSVCPFCETEAEWPNTVLAVYTKRTVDPVPFNIRITVRGGLSLGSHRDPDTGFLSLVRLTDATYAES